MQSDSSLPLSASANRSVWWLMAAGLAGSANIRAFDSALPQLSEAFGISLGQTGHFAAVYALAYGLCQLPFGILGDRRSKLKIVRALSLVSMVVILATIFAQSYEQMLALRLVAGASASAVIPLTIAYIGDTVPFERRQMTLALNMTALTTGLILGQVFGGLATDAFGWQAVPLLIAALYLPSVLGLKENSAAPSARKSAPLTPIAALRKILRTPFSRAVLFSAASEGVLIFAISAFFPLILVARFGLPPAQTGAALVVGALGSISNVLLLRRWPKTWGMRGHFVLGGALSICGIALVGFGPSLPFALLGLFAAGLGAAAVHNNLQTFGSQMLPEARATGFATFATTFFLAQALGGVIFAAGFDAYGVPLLALVPLPLIGLFTLWFARQISR